MSSAAEEVVLVFGGAGGIGLACCQAYLELKAKVLCCDVRTPTDSLHKWQSNDATGNVIFFQCDVTESAQVEAAFLQCEEEFQHKPTVVINTAAILDEFSPDKVINTNMGGTVRILSAALKRMGLDQGGAGGAVILFSSVYGIAPGAHAPVYAATKHGIVGLVRSFAETMHYRDHGVRISCLCPTVVDTPLLPGSLNGKMLKTDVLLSTSASNNVNQLSPQEVATEVITMAIDPESNGKVVCMSKMAGVKVVVFEDQPPF